MSKPLLVSFAAGPDGAWKGSDAAGKGPDSDVKIRDAVWKIDRIEGVTGESLSAAARLQIFEQDTPQAASGTCWLLRGVVSNIRYATRPELDTLAEKQQGLGRPEATCAALIPIRKNAAWWALAQDERRSLMEEQGRHFSIGLEYLPSVARRLYHSRDFGEPFDFLTWFEYAPKHSAPFEEMVGRLRASPEWSYVDREVDIRLSR